MLEIRVTTKRHSIRLHNNMSSHKIRIEPPGKLGDLNLREIWAFRDLVAILTMRDVKLRYKQTVLGVAWVILQPLVAALIFAIVFGWFAKFPSQGVAYLPFVFAGLLPWGLFAGAVQRAGNSLITDSKLITKVYFPRMVIPLSSVISVCIDFVVSFIVMVALLVLYRIPLTWQLLSLPFIIAVTILIASGVSLYISALNVYYRDFMYALPFLIQVWMYASPIVYPVDIVPTQFKSIYALNPLVGIIEAFRWALLGLDVFPTLAFGVSVGVGLLLIWSGTLFFRRIEHNFADVV
jgi:lipopolysaccharide transport system permease protein